LHSLSPELKLIFNASKTFSHGQETDAFLEEKVNYNYLLALALGNGVLPLLNPNIFSQCDIKQKFITEVDNIKRKNFFMSAQLLHLNYLLEEKQIQILPIKGPLLALHAYGDVSLRPFSDLDILVQRKDLLDVAHLLLSLGYENEHDLGVLSHPYILDHFSDISFFNPQNGITIELHWKLLKKTNAQLGNIENLFDKSINISLQNSLLKSLPLEEEFLYLCIHAAKHRFERIEWMNDLSLLFQVHEQDYNWETLLTMAKSEASLTPYLLALKILAQDYNQEVPHKASQKLLNKKKVLILYQQVWVLHTQDYVLQEKKKGIRYMELFFAIKLEDGILRKLSIFKTIFFPLYMNDILSTTQFPKPLSFLYYLVRLKRVVTKDASE